MFEDPYENAARSLIAPSSGCFEITLDDSQDLERATKALYVGSGGDIVLRPVGSNKDVTFRNTISGSILDIRVRAVRASGTSAQFLVGLV